MLRTASKPIKSNVFFRHELKYICVYVFANANAAIAFALAFDCPVVDAFALAFDSSALAIALPFDSGKHNEEDMANKRWNMQRDEDSKQ